MTKKWTDKKIETTRGEIMAYTLHICERVLFVYGIKIKSDDRSKMRNAIGFEFDKVFSDTQKMFQEYSKLDQSEIDKMIEELKSDEAKDTN